MPPLRFAILGLGNIAPVHAAAIRVAPDCALTAVASRDPERGRAFTAEHGGAWHADYREVLARADVDVVTIAAPHNWHAPMTLAAAAAGKHVWCEKPMARTAAECDAMLAACEQAGVMLGVVFQSRFDPLSRRLKAILDSGQLGKIMWASASTLWHRDEAYYAARPWRQTWAESGGGVLINQAVHAIDLLLWLRGLPAQVTAQIGTLAHAVEVEDAALAILNYPDGGLGLIQATTAAFPGYPERLEFFGANGSAVLHKGEGRLEWRRREPDEAGVEQAEVSSGAARPMDITAAAHTAQLCDFVSAIRERRPPLVDGREGRRSLALLDAIYESARTRQPALLRA